MQVEAWLLLPYIDALDQEYLHDVLQVGRWLIPTLERHFEAKKLTPEFLRDWGNFCRAAGALQLVDLSDTNLGRLREAQGGRKNNLDAQRRWFAHYCLQLVKDGQSLISAKKSVEGLIQDIVSGNKDIPD